MQLQRNRNKTATETIEKSNTKYLTPYGQMKMNLKIKTAEINFNALKCGARRFQPSHTR